MKKRISGFISGFLCACLFLALTATAIAASDSFTIEVNPINIKVNGEVFQPIDANGNAVQVFVYKGTTYAPLRALAEAYGLRVGYDAASNLATVVDPDVAPSTPVGGKTEKPNTSATEEIIVMDEAEYQAFKSMWTIELDFEADWHPMVNGVDYSHPYKRYNLRVEEEYTQHEYASMITDFKNKGFTNRLARELCPDASVWVELDFDCLTTGLKVNIKPIQI